MVLFDCIFLLLFTACLCLIYPSRTATINLQATKMYAWGAPESIGEDIPQDFLVPQDVDELVVDVSAGTDYTLLILADGSVRVGGNIFLPEEYQGMSN